jgi:hypothetical protein
VPDCIIGLLVGTIALSLSCRLYRVWLEDGATPAPVEEPAAG